MVEKNNILDKSQYLIFKIFWFFQHLRYWIEISTETYGSFRVEFLNDEDGKILKENSLFNLYDLWTVNRSGFLLETYELKIVKLKKIIKKKWRGKKDLPVFKVLIQKIKEGDEMFNPVEHLDGDHEQYFSKLQVWK